MCSVSMIGDHYAEKWQNPPWQNFPGQIWPPHSLPGVTREEFEALRRDVAEMKALLIRAKAYDEKHGEPDCEIEEKMDLLRKVAKLVGVNLDDVIGKAAP